MESEARGFAEHEVLALGHGDPGPGPRPHRQPSHRPQVLGRLQQSGDKQVYADPNFLKAK